MKLAVVIAAYDEAASIGPLTRRLAATLAAIPDCAWELIFVVEGEDGTREALERLAREIAPLRVLYRRAPTGLGAAFRRGFAAVAADADYVVTLDADLNHQPEEIPRLLAAAGRPDCDVLVGSRFVAGAEIAGTPGWKRLLSGAMNRLMTRLYGLRVRDKTSGFRIYRARVLREVAYENDRFAFLPELLIRARAAGFRVAEEPIHFLYRREGRSKMAFWPTVASYLALLGRQGDRWTWATLAIVAAGAALRLAANFPSYKYPNDGDCALTGITALRLLHGHLPVFFATPRIGAIASYVTAPFFLAFGPSRDSLAGATLLLDLALFAAWCLLLREIFGRRLALAAMPFAALPAPAFTQLTAQPNGYPETLLLCVVPLWLAARLARGAGNRFDFLGFGLAVGLGWWTSLLTLACTAPAAAWMLWRRPRLLASARFPALASLGFLLGAFPWIAYHLRYREKLFHDNYAVMPAHGVGAMIATGRRLLLTVLPATLAPDRDPFPAGPVASLLRVPSLMIIAAGVIVCLGVAPLARRRHAGRTGAASGPPAPAAAATSAAQAEQLAWPLCALVLLVTFGLNLASQASAGQGPHPAGALSPADRAGGAGAARLPAAARRQPLAGGGLPARRHRSRLQPVGHLAAMVRGPARLVAGGRRRPARSPSPRARASDRAPRLLLAGLPVQLPIARDDPRHPGGGGRRLAQGSRQDSGLRSRAPGAPGEPAFPGGLLDRPRRPARKAHAPCRKLCGPAAAARGRRPGSPGPSRPAHCRLAGPAARRRRLPAAPLKLYLRCIPCANAPVDPCCCDINIASLPLSDHPEWPCAITVLGMLFPG